MLGNKENLKKKKKTLINFKVSKSYRLCLEPRRNKPKLNNDITNLTEYNFKVPKCLELKPFKVTSGSRKIHNGHKDSLYVRIPSSLWQKPCGLSLSLHGEGKTLSYLCQSIWHLGEASLNLT